MDEPKSAMWKFAWKFARQSPKIKRDDFSTIHFGLQLKENYPRQCGARIEYSMRTEVVLKIIWRLGLKIFVFGSIGALLFGLPWIILLSSLLRNYRSASGFGFPGFFIGFAQLSLVALLTWKQRSWGETLQMSIGGFFVGGLIGLILGRGTIFVLNSATRFKSSDIVLSLGFIFCATIGTFYFALHPKYATREEPVIIFSDDYLKDEKIEWK